MNEPRYKTLSVMLRVDIIVRDNSNPGHVAGSILNQVNAGLATMQFLEECYIQRVDIDSIATGRPETYEKAKGVHPES